MKKIFESKRINYLCLIIISIMYLIIILKGGTGIIFEYKVEYPGGSSSPLIATVMPYANRIIN